MGIAGLPSSEQRARALVSSCWIPTARPKVVPISEWTATRTVLPATRMPLIRWAGSPAWPSAYTRAASSAMVAVAALGDLAPDVDRKPGERQDDDDEEREQDEDLSMLVAAATHQLMTIVATARWMKRPLESVSRSAEISGTMMSERYVTSTRTR